MSGRALAEYAVFIVVIALLFWLTPSWDDRAARKCQEQYGTQAHHPTGEHYCVMPDGAIKGLR